MDFTGRAIRGGVASSRTRRSEKSVDLIGSDDGRRPGEHRDEAPDSMQAGKTAGPEPDHEPPGARVAEAVARPVDGDGPLAVANGAGKDPGVMRVERAVR